MLTPSDIIKVKRFEELTSNHKRVFRHRLVRKFKHFQRDMEAVILNSGKLGIRIEKLVDLGQLARLIDLYQCREALQ